ncbi:MAG: hypothetical protein HKN25_13570 [Pyrinomonadaceae bacterium]|nr:hypothetical protein [Pyrinomonadaceae bacterium]
MKLIAEFEGRQIDVTIKREESRVLAEIEGRIYQLEATKPEPDVYLLKNDNKVFETYVSGGPASPMALNVRVGTDEFEFSLQDPKRLRGSGGEADKSDGAAEITTAMPGKVVKVILNKGDVVAKGEGVIVVEAMKMQNELKSPKDGVVQEIRFAEGDTVNAGDVLSVIE